MDARRSETWFFVIALALAIYVSWLILMPYIGVLVLAGTLAYLFHPLYKNILRGVRYESLAAFVVVIVVALIVFLPLIFFGVRMFGEATALYFSLSSHGGFAFTIGTTIFNFNTYIQQGLN